MIFLGLYYAKYLTTHIADSRLRGNDEGLPGMSCSKIVSRVIVISVLLALAFSVFAASNKTKLNRLTTSIKSLQGTIRITHRKKQTLQQKLRRNEIGVGNIAYSLRRTKRNLVYERVLLRKLYTRKHEYELQLLKQQQGLAEQMRAIYSLGKRPVIRLLLNKEDPTKLGRVFVYYNYLQQYRVVLIYNINKTLLNLQYNKRKIIEQSAKLRKLKLKQEREYSQLVVMKSAREQLLKKITRRLHTQKERLAKLVADKKALESLIARLESQTTAEVFAKPWNKLKRKLPWPTKGRVENLFGRRIANSQLRWNGVVISAPSGRGVHAIATGKVVFAQWLRGYGLLLIINHGHGYMSLYGRNNSLYKKVGDIVQANDLIATVGDSGGYARPGVYFAIRYKGKPVNPGKWCR